MSNENHIPVGVCYREWKHRKSGTSWKEIIRRKADYFISVSDSFEDFLLRLEQHGFTVKRGKYISVKLPDRQRFVRLKTLGENYSEVCIFQRINERFNSKSAEKTINEIISETVNKFGFEMRKFSFVQSVKDTTAMLVEQLKIINEEGLSSIQDVRNKLVDIRNEIRKTQEQLNTWSKHFVKNYDEIATLKNALATLEKQENIYKDILQTCSNEGYISHLVRLTHEKMTEQENAKLRELQQEKYTIYCPREAEQLPYKNLSKRPSIDEYFQVSEGNWIDIDGNDLAEKLEEIYQQNSIPIGSVIVVRDSEKTQYFYVNDVGFVRFSDFEKSLMENLEQQQQENKNAAKWRGR